ncbi:MAG: alanine racemase [Anaerolineae bacterium]
MSRSNARTPDDAPRLDGNCSVIRLADLLAANPDAEVLGPVFADRFTGFCFDSRIVQPGEIFMAVRTAKADGHDYILDACRGGAAGVICQDEVDLAGHGVTCVRVPDTEVAVQRYAALAVPASGARVVALTGSVGKTTTKEAVAWVLGRSHRVFRNPANYSGRYGLPIALGGLGSEHEIAVLEMATDQFGEIAMLAAMAPPEVAVVTRVAPAHLEAFVDVEAVAREKGDLVAALPADGLAVLNADDPRVAAMAERTSAEVALCGFVPSADVRATDVRVTRDGTEFMMEMDGRQVAARMPWLGEHFALAGLQAAAVARRFGVPLSEVVEALAELPPVPGRLNPVPGRAGSLILDDSYNASPAAVVAGLDVLCGLDAERRVAVLGAMAELGDAAEESHRQVGREAATRVDALIASGREAEWIADGARAAGMAPESIHVTYTVDDAVAAVEPYLAPGTVVLAKGSAVARMERVVEGLMARPEHAAEALVRQDAAWQQIVVLRPERPTWLEIDLGAIGANVRHLRDLAGDAALMAVLKADAYGHGAVQVAHTALRNGAEWCGVACLSEAEVLRRAGIDAPVLILGYTPGWQARDALRLGVSLTVFDLDTARALSRAATALDRTARVHVKVDTGMHRLGVPVDDAPEFVVRLREMPGIEVEGLFTHLAQADDTTPDGQAATADQLRRFDALLAELTAAGTRPPLVHAGNSAALISGAPALYDLVRPGIAVYGLASSEAVVDGSLRPALTWKTQIAQLHDVAPGQAVGYGGAWRAERQSVIATIPVGYADGFRRAPATWRHVLVRGRAAPVVGRVSMDQSGIDVTDVTGARRGDEVVLIGEQAGAAITVEQVAEWLDTINYEVVSEILARVPRVS